ncbi:MAG TPA: cell wall hydrolase [Clostridiales bacterium]|nr:MAG: cell wall hydrolase [Clostridiales bacterium GWD2_32_59]HAN10722.1 cell wall hydrolase [Clostridiales bacterium]
MAYSTRELFARLIKCEAGGEGENGMKAVATSIMNRVHVSYGEYLRTGGGNLRNVINQPYQYTCMMPMAYGEVNPQTIWSSPPEQIHYDIADWALAGNKHQGANDSLWYFNPYSPGCTDYFPPNRSGSYFNTVGQHCFYIPTPLYATTR